MAKMVMELIKRWKCRVCGYITCIEPKKGECPSCTFGKDINYDLRDDEENEQKD